MYSLFRIPSTPVRRTVPNLSPTWGTRKCSDEVSTCDISASHQHSCWRETVGAFVIDHNLRNLQWFDLHHITSYIQCWLIILVRQNIHICIFFLSEFNWTVARVVYINVPYRNQVRCVMGIIASFCRKGLADANTALVELVITNQKMFFTSSKTENTAKIFLHPLTQLRWSPGGWSLSTQPCCHLTATLSVSSSALTPYILQPCHVIHTVPHNWPWNNKLPWKSMTFNVLVLVEQKLVAFSLTRPLGWFSL